MLFSSNVFLFLFLPAALLGYQVLSRFGRTALLLWLTATSLVFYGWWNPKYLLLLCGSILMNFLFSQALGEGRSETTKSRVLVLGITANLLLLGFYKYLFPFLIFLHGHGVLPWEVAEVVLPLGISFFTFTQIAYLIDLRQGIAKKQGIVPYSVFVTFFPHLIAGPIIHPREMMPQMDEGRIGGLKVENLTLGVTWFVMGLGKKVLIADRVAPLADAVYGHVHEAGWATAWFGALAYSMQLYFDFSGYSDMALGLARMFGIEFPINFNSPMKAESVIDFWQRWHMTLTRYLGEYLFTPILRWVNGRRMDAGKKVTRKATATLEGYGQMVLFPTLTTMFLAGVWHGAGVKFLLFGVLHGVYLSVNHGWRILTPKGTRWHAVIPGYVMVLVTYCCVLVGQMVFRAEDVRDAVYLGGTMLGAHGRGVGFAGFPYLRDLPTVSRFMGHASTAALALAVCFAIVWGMPNTQEILGQVPEGQVVGRSWILAGVRWRVSLGWSLGVAVVLCLAMLMLDAGGRFLYFQF